MISVVSVYHDASVLEAWLLKSLEKQTADHERILLDNTNEKFEAAARALNRGGKQANGNYIMFAHQDVKLETATFLEDLEDALNKFTRLGIAGVAGRVDRYGVMTNIKHGDPPEYAGNKRVTIPEQVQTIDECLFIIPKNLFQKYGFDELVCDGWHLYSVEYSLRMLLSGYKVYVLPFSIYHKSRGTPLTNEYYSTLENLLGKYEKKFEWVYTTCGSWSTLIPLNKQIEGGIARLLAIKKYHNWSALIPELIIKINRYTETIKNIRREECAPSERTKSKARSGSKSIVGWFEKKE